jgi:biopolymer transport protein ExbB
LFALLVAERSRLERFLGAIAVTATVSPLLGLLGTVSGMISTFNMMTLFGAGDPSIVSGGISEALVTTELGLIVAIPALIMHALLSRKAGSYVESLEACAIAITRSPGTAS